MSGITFYAASPPSGETVKVMQLEQIVYWVKLDAGIWVDEGKIQVEAWTNAKHKDNPAGRFEGLRLPYLGPCEGCVKASMFGRRMWLTQAGQYEVTFRARLTTSDPWFVFSDYGPAKIHVERSPYAYTPKPFQFLAVSPKPVSIVDVHQFSDVMYWAKLKIASSVDPATVCVQAWTNVRSVDNPEGVFHGVTLSYRGPADTGDGSVFAEREILAAVGDYEVTFRAKLRHKKRWIDVDADDTALLRVDPPLADKSNWSPRLRKAPDYVRLAGPVYFGNVRAIETNAHKFTHVMCLSDELVQPKLPDDVIYCHVPIPGGVENHIAYFALLEAVEWLQQAWEQASHAGETLALSASATQSKDVVKPSVETVQVSSQASFVSSITTAGRYTPRPSKEHLGPSSGSKAAANKADVVGPVSSKTKAASATKLQPSKEALVASKPSKTAPPSGGASKTGLPAASSKTVATGSRQPSKQNAVVAPPSAAGEAVSSKAELAPVSSKSAVPAIVEVTGPVEEAATDSSPPATTAEAAPPVDETAASASAAVEAATTEPPAESAATAEEPISEPAAAAVEEPPAAEPAVTADEPPATSTEPVEVTNESETASAAENKEEESADKNNNNNNSNSNNSNTEGEEPAAETEEATTAPNDVVNDAVAPTEIAADATNTELAGVSAKTEVATTEEGAPPAEETVVTEKQDTTETATAAPMEVATDVPEATAESSQETSVAAESAAEPAASKADEVAPVSSKTEATSAKNSEPAAELAAEGSVGPSASQPPPAAAPEVVAASSKAEIAPISSKTAATTAPLPAESIQPAEQTVVTKTPQKPAAAAAMTTKQLAPAAQAASKKGRATVVKPPAGRQPAKGGAKGGAAKAPPPPPAPAPSSSKTEAAVGEEMKSASATPSAAEDLTAGKSSVRIIPKETPAATKRQRILIYSTYGFSRVASVVIAFVLANNADMTYEEALSNVCVRRPVLPHCGLKEACYNLFPRSPSLVTCVSFTRQPQNINGDCEECKKELFKFQSVCPRPLETFEAIQFSPIVYYVTLQVNDGIEPTQIVVQAWTNVRSVDNPEGVFHGVTLSYRGPADTGDGSMYAEREVLAVVGSYEVTFRAKSCADLTEWTWLHGGTNAYISVTNPPADELLDKSLWAPEFQEAAEFTVLIDPVCVGSAAAAESNAGRFSHMLCVAQEIVKPDKMSIKMIYHQIRIEAGTDKPINEQLLSEAVEWIRGVWSLEMAEGAPKKRLLIYSSDGFGRAGNVALAFVLAENSMMTYTEALRHVTVRRPVLPHSGLKQTIYRLYPRAWARRRTKQQQQQLPTTTSQTATTAELTTQQLQQQITAPESS